MTKRVQRVRHDNAGSSAFLGKLGEITVNTGNKSLHVHDGINEGGTESARADLVNVAVATAGNVGKMSAQQAAELAQALLDIVINAANITSNDALTLLNTDKLATVETGAQVTSTAHVTTAGALMDSEVDADLKTFALPANTTISAFGRTLIDDAAASNARSTLGLLALATRDTVGSAQIDANAVGQSEIAASAVGQSELKSTTAIYSVSVTNTINPTSSINNSAVILAAGGTYQFTEQIRAVKPATTYVIYARGSLSGGSNQTASTTSSNDTGYDSNIGLTISATNLSGSAESSRTYTAYTNLRYIQASPPYDLGDGVVGRFIFAIIDNTTSRIEAIYNAAEAPWHYNGPTDIRGKLAADGKKYRTRRDMSGHPVTLEQAKLNIGLLKAYNLAFRNAPVIQEEITQDIKQADMGLIPHPFMGNDLTGKTVVMLDPVSDLNFELAELSQHGEFNINELLHDGYLKISNQGLQRAGPAGILIPSFSWKNS